MPRTRPEPPAGFPDFRRRVDGTVRPQEWSGGPARLLVRLVAGGLDPDALDAAATLVLALDDQARAGREARRIKARRAGQARWEQSRAA